MGKLFEFVIAIKFMFAFWCSSRLIILPANKNDKVSFPNILFIYYSYLLCKYEFEFEFVANISNR